MSLENKTHLGEKWIKLKASFSNILLNPALEKDSYVNAFDDAYTLMMFRQFRVIHDGLRELIREHLQAKVYPEVLAALNEKTFIATVLLECTNFAVSIKKIRNTILYMEEKPQVEMYLEEGEETIEIMVVHLFREVVLGQGGVLERLKEAVSEAISLDRKGEVINRSYILSLGSVLKELGPAGGRSFYEDAFETQFFAQSLAYYQAQNEVFAKEEKVIAIVEKIDSLVIAEKQRIQQMCCDEITQIQSRQLLNQEIVMKNMDKILNDETSGFVFMLQEGDLYRLLRVYTVLKFVPIGLREIGDRLNTYTKAQGSALMVIRREDPKENGAVFIENMLILKQKLYDMLEISFGNDDFLRTEIAVSIQSIFKQMPDSPKYFARYIDALMKRGADKSSVYDPELDKVIVLSHFLDEEKKLEFRQLWDKKLYKRLLIHDRVPVGEFTEKVAEDMMENCRVQLEKMIIQMRPFLLENYSPIPLDVFHYPPSMLVNIQELMLKKHAERAYIAFRELIAHFCHSTVRTDPFTLITLSFGFIRTMKMGWSRFDKIFRAIRMVFQKIDNHFVQLPNVENYSKTIGNRLMDLVTRQRFKSDACCFDMKVNCQFLIHFGLGHRLGPYENGFEKPFLLRTAAYYSLRASALLRNKTTFEYINTVEGIIFKELDHIETYFADEEARQKTRFVLNKELYVKQLEMLLENKESGLISMIQKKQNAQLQVVLSVFTKVQGAVPAMAKCFSAHFRPGCEETLKSQKILSDFDSFMIELFKSKTLYDQFVNISKEFKEHSVLRKMVTTDFELLMSLNPNAAEHFALYVDKQMRTIQDCEAKTMAKDVNRMLDEAFFFFRFIRDKDLLEFSCRKLLAKRLLFKSISVNSIDCEKGLICRIKNECGDEYTTKMDDMIQDISSSVLLTTEFAAEYKTNKSMGNVEFDVRVLSNGIWPLSLGYAPYITLSFGPFAALEAFNSFYDSKHSNRCLTLQPALGTAEIDAVFYDLDVLNPGCRTGDTRLYSLTVSTYQMCVLMLFNDSEKLSYEDIFIRSSIPKKELDSVLRALVMGKASRRVLAKEPKGNELEGSVFFVNDCYHSNRYRANILTPDVTDDCEMEKKPAIPDTVEEDRKHLIDANIIRIMKSIKELKHDRLVAEVIHRLKKRFIPTPEVINNRIESLIEREFLVRDHEKEIYVYIM